MELLLVLRAQCCVGIDDGDQFCIMLLRKGVQEAGDVPVFETDDRDADGWCCAKTTAAANTEDDGESKRFAVDSLNE